MTLSANWSYPTDIRFGAGRIAELGECCKEAGITRPLLVTDRGLASLPITQDTLDLMEQAGLGRAMFSEVDPNPTEINMEAGRKVFLDGNHDGVIAFGGGSGLDLGKLLAFMAGQTRPVWVTGGNARMPMRLPPSLPYQRPLARGRRSVEPVSSSTVRATSKRSFFIPGYCRRL